MKHDNKNINIRSLYKVYGFSPSRKGIENDTLLLYLPGWSISSDSLSVQHFCETIAKSLKLSVHAIQTTPRVHLTDSLLQEAAQIDSILSSRIASSKKIILIAHSQGAVKLLHMVSFLPQEKIQALIFITPVGLYPLSWVAINMRFMGEIGKTLWQAAREHLFFSADSHLHSDLVASVAFYLLKEMKNHSFLWYMERLISESNELARAHRFVKKNLQQHSAFLFFILAGNDFISSPKKIAKIISTRHDSLCFKILPQANHTLPYTQSKMVAMQIKKVLKFIE